MVMEMREPLFGKGEGGFFLAKCETNLGSAIAGVIVKAGAGYDRHADFFHEKFSESEVIGKSETRDVRHDVVCAAGFENGESGARKDVQKPFPAHGIVLGEFLVVRLRRMEGNRACLLQGGGGAD